MAILNVARASDPLILTSLLTFYSSSCGPGVGATVGDVVGPGLGEADFINESRRRRAAVRLLLLNKESPISNNDNINTISKRRRIFNF